MNIINDFPPNYAKIKAALSPGPRAIFCYGDTVYNPGGGELSGALGAHEATHNVQQGDDPEGWWDCYLDDPAFRLAEEIPAHQNEWLYFVSRGTNRNERRRMLKIIASRLSGKLYGNLVNFKLAKEIILFPEKRHLVSALIDCKPDNDVLGNENE